MGFVAGHQGRPVSLSDRPGDDSADCDPARSRMRILRSSSTPSQLFVRMCRAVARIPSNTVGTRSHPSCQYPDVSLSATHSIRTTHFHCTDDSLVQHYPFTRNTRAISASTPVDKQRATLSPALITTTILPTVRNHAINKTFVSIAKPRQLGSKPRSRRTKPSGRATHDDSPITAVSDRTSP